MCQLEMQRGAYGKVPNQPLIEASVPASPETRDRIIIGHAANHVFWWIHPIQQRP